MTIPFSNPLRLATMSMVATALVLASASIAAAETHEIEPAPYSAETSQLTLSFLAHDLGGKHRLMRSIERALRSPLIRQPGSPT